MHSKRAGEVCRASAGAASRSRGFSGGLGKLLIVLGIVITLIGVGLLFADRIPFIGRLPGDIYVKRGNFTFYFPLATSIVISILLTLVFWIFRR